MPSPCITLTDNGSLRPEAVFSLRRLAELLSARTGYPIHPVSLLHSHKISPAKLHGVPAETFEKFVLSRRAEGVDEFVVLPLFFGPSAAIAEYLPQRVDAIREAQSWPALRVRIAPCLVDPEAKDEVRLASMLADLVHAKQREIAAEQISVAVVDHGSPRVAVTQVRNFLAGQLAQLLGNTVAEVRPCSMERRESAAYDFNEPLLERLLGQPGFERHVIVSMLFLQPGRHAGPGGDVATICQEAERTSPGLQTYLTDLVGSHPALIGLLAERLQAGLEAEPVSWKALVTNA